MKNDNVEDGIHLPTRPFLYTLDQIATLTGMSQDRLERDYIYFDTVTNGAIHNRLRAIDIGTPDRPDWRVQEAHLVWWFKRRGFRFYQRNVL